MFLATFPSASGALDLFPSASEHPWYVSEKNVFEIPKIPHALTGKSGANGDGQFGAARGRDSQSSPRGVLRSQSFLRAVP